MNRRNTAGIFLVVLITGVSAETVSANGFGLLDQDAFATARGEAFVATADNPSAIYFNPAGITQGKGNNLRAGIYGIRLDPSYRPPGGGATYHSSADAAAVPQFFYTFNPEKLPLSFGLGLYAPFGGNMSWPQVAGFRTVATQGSLTYLRINPVAAYQLLPSLSIGAGLTLNDAKIDLEQGLQSFQTPPNSFRFTGKGWSAGYNFGLLWQPLEKISIGASFRSETRFTLKGETTSEFLPQIPEQHVSAQADFTFPLTVAWGLSYRPTSKWNLEFDADYNDWSSFGSTTINQSTKPRGINQYIPVNLGWRASWMYGLGVTRYFDNGWHVSAGYVFNENSVPGAYYTPLAADMDRHFLSVGTGFLGKTYNFDIAYQFGYGPTHTVTGSTPSTTPGQFAGESADGHYRFISHAVSVSVGMHF